MGKLPIVLVIKRRNYTTRADGLKDKDGARNRNRTGTPSLARDFKSLVSTNFTIRAKRTVDKSLEARAGVEPTYTDLQSGA